MFDVLVPLIAPVVIFGAVYLLKMRSAAAAGGVPASQVNLIPEHWTEPLRPLNRRRMLAALWMVLVLVGFATTWTAGDSMPAAPIGVMFVGIIISHTTRTMAEQQTDALDERMLAARNQAFRTSYYILGGFVAAVLALVGFFGEALWDSATITLDTTAFVRATFLIAVTVLYLPSAILAWTEDII